jgi:hypothetical protein
MFGDLTKLEQGKGQVNWNELTYYNKRASAREVPVSKMRTFGDFTS